MNRAVFLDKDGTLIKDVPYNVNTEMIELLPEVVGGLKLLQKLGFYLFIISNQSGIARGYFSKEDLHRSFEYLQGLLFDEGIKLEGIYYCPHHKEGTVTQYAISCQCRKPLPGLLFQISKKCSIDLKESWMIGDILNDIEAGHLAGCRSILVDNGNETEWNLSSIREPDYTVKTPKEAALIIMNNMSRKDQDTYEQLL